MDAGETLYYSNDANMNVTALVSASSGSVVERYVYSPYGSVTIYDDDWSDTVAWANSKKNEILFCGYRWDPESGNYHVRHRNYHPTVGRFLNRDPIGYAGAASLYQYVVSSPLTLCDPAGLYPWYQHAAMTGSAFGAGFVEPAGRECKEWMLSTLTAANVGQDSGTAFKENWRHYNRGVGQDPEQANREFMEYLTGEQMVFDAELDSVRPPPCDTREESDACVRALQALGRMSHTWQDYFDHASLASGEFSAWSQDPPIRGTPDDMNPKLVPSSWGGLRNPGTHGISISPGAYDYSIAVDRPESGTYRGVYGGVLREFDAQVFVAEKFRGLLSKWYNVCKCCCPPKTGAPAAPTGRSGPSQSNGGATPLMDGGRVGPMIPVPF